MSVFEPQDIAGSAAGTGIDPPDFPVVVRGYDRQRVNAYLQSMRSQLATERDRAAQAEQAAANSQPPTFEHLGAEAMKVLELASNSAELLIAQAKGRGEEIIQEAEGQAADLFEEAKQRAERLHAAARGTLSEAADERDRILGEAREEGTQIRTLAEDDARAMLEEAQSASQRTWQKVRDECTVMQTETDRLRKLRDRTMSLLGHAQTELNSLLAGLPEDEQDEQDEPFEQDGDDAGVGLEATATTGQELVESAEPDAAPAVRTEPGSAASAEPETAPAARPEPDRSAASARGQHQPARSG